MHEPELVREPADFLVVHAPGHPGEHNISVPGSHCTGGMGLDGVQNARGDDPVSLALTCWVLAGECVIDAETNQQCFRVLSVFAAVDWLEGGRSAGMQEAVK